MCVFLQESPHTDDDPDPTGLDGDRKSRYCAYIQEMPYDGIRHHHRDVGRPVEIRHAYYGLIGFIARSFQHRTACTTLIGEVLVCDSTPSPLSCTYRLVVVDSISMHSVLATIRRYLLLSAERRGTAFFVPRRLRGSDTYEVGKVSSERMLAHFPCQSRIIRTHSSPCFCRCVSSISIGLH